MRDARVSEVEPRRTPISTRAVRSLVETPSQFRSSPFSPHSLPRSHRPFSPFDSGCPMSAPQYDPLLPSFQRSLPTLSTSTRTSTPSSISPATVSPAAPFPQRSDLRPGSSSANPVHAAVSSAPRASPHAPPALLTESSHARALTSADRSTAHSPSSQRTATWPAGGTPHVAAIKPEDEGASFNAAPGLSPTGSPLAPYPQTQGQHYHYATGFHEQAHYSQPSHYYGREAPLSVVTTQGGYPAPAAYPYPHQQQPAYTRATNDSDIHTRQPSHPHHHHPHYSYGQSPLAAHPEGCECASCAHAAAGMAPPPPLSPPTLEFARKSALQGWNGDTPVEEHAGVIPSPDWPQGTHQGAAGVGASRYSSWQDTSQLGSAHSQTHPPHLAMQHVAPASYPPERGSYMSDMAGKWASPSFEYTAIPSSNVSRSFPVQVRMDVLDVFFLS